MLREPLRKGIVILKHDAVVSKQQSNVDIRDSLQLEMDISYILKQTH